MDKRVAKIALACLMSTIIVFLLYLLALRLWLPSCELVHIEPGQLRAAQLRQFDSDKPLRARHDKALLLKMAAYLEYNIPPPPSSATNSNPNSSSNNEAKPSQSPPASTDPQQQQQQQQAGQLTPTGGGAQQQPISPPPLGQSASASSSSAGGGHRGHGAPPTPSVPSTGFTQQQLQNQSYVTAASSSSSPSATSGSSGQSAAGQSLASNQQQQQQLAKADRRFLPLELQQIESHKLEDNKVRYTLTFNCSSLSMVFVKSPQRVHVESMSLELTPPSRHKTSCEVHLPPMGVFGVEAQEGVAGYLCKTGGGNGTSTGTSSGGGGGGGQHHLAFQPTQMRYLCYSSNSNANQNKPARETGLLLAELHINAIQFETTTNSSEHLKKDSFKRRPSECRHQ